MFIPCPSNTCDFADFDLILPSVSVGNVGQLAADLLIQNLNLSRFGYLHDDSFLPVVGNDPFASESGSKECHLMTAAEVYASTEKKLAVVQQRSPIIKHKKTQYMQKLFEWIIQNHFKRVIVLTSSFAHERRDSQLVGTQLRFLLSQEMRKEVLQKFTDEFHWKELEERKEVADSVYLPGAGVAKALYQKCCDANLSCAVLLIFCAEGDNAGDAIQLASYLNTWKGWLNLKELAASPEKSLTLGWTLPSSWKLQYGSQFDQSLFQ